MAIDVSIGLSYTHLRGMMWLVRDSCDQKYLFL